jgi:hypothetical protein
MPAEAPSPPAEAAEQALAFLTEMSVDVRGGAILGGGGEVLAASGDRDAWREAATALLAAADSADGRPVDQVHVGTGGGEVFAVREGGLTAVVVTDRFTLASLMAFDMRSALRDLGRGGASGAGASAGTA